MELQTTKIDRRDFTTLRDIMINQYLKTLSKISFINTEDAEETSLILNQKISEVFNELDYSFYLNENEDCYIVYSKSFQEIREDVKFFGYTKAINFAFFVA